MILRGFLIGTVIYALLVGPIYFSESQACAQVAQQGNGIGMCGLISAWAIVILFPIIPIGAIVGWVKGHRKGERDPKGNMYWLKGLIVAMAVWSVIAFISERFYFYGNNPELWKTLFLGHTEAYALKIYLLAGLIIGFVVGLIKRTRK